MRTATDRLNIALAGIESIIAVMESPDTRDAEVLLKMIKQLSSSGGKFCAEAREALAKIREARDIL